MHEIVTLQIGQQANYLGTHYWNSQESYFTYAGQEESPVDHDISFRSGIGADGGDTYSPRTLIYDLKGAFGTLRRENALYQLQQQAGSTHHGPWSGSTIPLQLPPITPSAYQQALDQGDAPPQLSTSTVRFWSDFNHLFYHPRSIVQLSDYELNSSLMPFERWQTGEELFSSLDREHDLLDRDLRPFLEDCDQLQALQIFSSIDDAWGGFASRYLERISDDMGKGCRWIFGLKDGVETTRDRAMLRNANSIQTLLSVNATASVHIPLTSVPPSLPAYISYDKSSLWHSSALQASVVESMTLPTRLRGTDIEKSSFGQLETTLNNEGRKRLAMAGFSVDDPTNLDGDHHNMNGTSNGVSEDELPQVDVTMFPSINHDPSYGRPQRSGRRSHLFSSVFSLRGQWKSSLGIALSNESSRDRFVAGPRTSYTQSQLLFPLLTSFPNIFHFPDRPEKLAIKTCLSASTAVADQLREFERMSVRLIGLEDREAVRNGLAEMAEEYEDGWNGSDESDDND